MLHQDTHEPKEHQHNHEPPAMAEFNHQINSLIDRDKFWEPVPGSNTGQPLEYSSQATAFAIPLFETLHRLAGNPEVNLRDDDPTGQPRPSDDRPLAESVRQFGVLCYTLHVLQEQATRNFNSDYHPHQTVAAGSELLRSLSCLAFQVEPYFSEPEELEARAEPLLPELLPAINPITAEDFPKD